MQKKRNFIIMLVLLVSCIALIVILGQKEEDKTIVESDSNNSSKKEIEKKSEEENYDLKNKYISLTVTRDETPEKSEQNIYASEVYIYDIDKDHISKQGEIFYLTPYPLAVYDNWKNTIYYSQLDDIKQQGGLMEFSCKTEDIHHITSEIGYINYIFPFDKERLFVVGTGKHHAIEPFFCDKNSGKVTEIEWNSDDFLWEAAHVPKEQSVYVSCYSEKQDKKINNKLSKEGKDAIGVPDHYIYKINKEGTRQKILKEKRKYIDKIAANSKKLIYRVSTEWLPNENNTKVYSYYMDTKEKVELSLDKKQFWADYVYLTEDGKLLYYISREETEEERICQFCVYDMEEKTEKVLFETKGVYGDPVINNAQVIFA